MNMSKKEDQRLKLENMSEYIQLLLSGYVENDQCYKQFWSRSIYQSIFDLTGPEAYCTGESTVEALKKPKGNRSKEHWYGGDKFAIELMELAITDGIPSVEYIQKFIQTKGTWRYTTKTENRILRENKQDYSSVSLLVDDPKTKTGFLCLTEKREGIDPTKNVFPSSWGLEAFWG